MGIFSGTQRADVGIGPYGQAPIPFDFSPIFRYNIPIEKERK